MKRGGPRHPKMLHLAALLGIPRWQAVGIWESLLHFAAAYARRGDVGRHPNQAIAADMEWTGDPDELVGALVKARFLDSCCSAHRLRVHDWPEHADQAVKRTEEVKRDGFLACYQQPSSGQLVVFPQKASQPVPLPLPLSVPLSVPVPEAEAVPAAGHEPPPPDPATVDDRVVEQLGRLSLESAQLATQLMELPEHRASVQALYSPGEACSVSPADVLRTESRIPATGRTFGNPRGGTPEWRLVTLERIQDRLPNLRAAVAAAGVLAQAREPPDAKAFANWLLLLGEVEKRINRHSYATWFRPTSGRLYQGNKLIVDAPDQTHGEWLIKNYQGVVAEAVEALKWTCEVEFTWEGRQAS